MEINELERFFVKEDQWISDRIIKVAKYSNYSVININPEDCLDLKSELWMILSKEKNLNIMRSFSDIKGKINNCCYLLLTKKNSKYIREKNFTNEKVDGYIKVKDILDDNENSSLSDYDENLEYIDTVMQRYVDESIKMDNILFNLYYQRKINTYASLAKHLRISVYSAGVLIKRLNYILKDMIKNDCSYELSKNKYENMAEYRKNKLGILEKVEDDCGCENCDECQDQVIEEEVILEDESIESDLIEEEDDVIETNTKSTKKTNKK